MRSTPKSLPRLSALPRLSPLLPLALALTALLTTPGDALAGGPRARVTPRASSRASAAITRTLARHDLASAAHIATHVTEVKTERRGIRTEVQCKVEIVVAAGAGSFTANSTATLRGRGRYAKSGRVDVDDAREACAASVAEELAATKIVPFLRSR